MQYMYCFNLYKDNLGQKEFLGLPSFTIFVFIDVWNYDYLFLKTKILALVLRKGSGCNLPPPRDFSQTTIFGNRYWQTIYKLY